MQLQTPSVGSASFNLSASDTYKSGQWMWQLTINAVTANYRCCRHQTIVTKKLLLYDVNKFITFIVRFIKRGGGWHQEYLDVGNIVLKISPFKPLNLELVISSCLSTKVSPISIARFVMYSPPHNVEVIMFEELQLQSVDLNLWRHPVHGTIYRTWHHVSEEWWVAAAVRGPGDLETWTRRGPEWSRC